MFGNTEPTTVEPWLRACAICWSRCSRYRVRPTGGPRHPVLSQVADLIAIVREDRNRIASGSERKITAETGRREPVTGYLAQLTSRRVNLPGLYYLRGRSEFDFDRD